MSAEQQVTLPKSVVELAAWICDCYAGFIRENVMSADIERHPYVPQIEGTAEDLHAAVAAQADAPEAGQEAAAVQADPWHTAVLNECMLTEACYQEADPAATVRALIDWHVANGAAVQAVPPFGTKRAAALALYRPPFRFTHGYIYDATNQMVADQDGFEGAVETHIAARVRGWGRIGYLPDAAALQDEVGQVIADALTAFWAGAGEKTS